MAELGERTTGAAKAARQRKARAQARHVCWMIDNFKILGSHHTSKGTLMTERVTALEAQVSHLAAKLQASMEGKGTSGGGAEPHRTFAQGLDANCRGHEAIHSASPANKPNQQMATTAAGEYAGSGSRADHCEAEADEDEANGEPKHAEDEEELKGNNFEGEEEVEKDSGKNEQNDEQKVEEEVDSEVDEEEDDESCGSSSSSSRSSATGNTQTWHEGFTHVIGKLEEAILDLQRQRKAATHLVVDMERIYELDENSEDLQVARQSMGALAFGLEQLAYMRTRVMAARTDLATTEIADSDEESATSQGDHSICSAEGTVRQVQNLEID